MLIDAGDVIVHLFRPDVRDFYGLDKMWGVEDRSEVTTVRIGDHGGTHQSGEPAYAAV